MISPVPQPPLPQPPSVQHVLPSSEHFTPGRHIWGVPTKLKYIVIHNTEGFNSLEHLSTEVVPPSTAVSAHVLVMPNGTRYNIVQYDDTAYHVGAAKAPYQNANSWGIEFENLSTFITGTQHPYPLGQIQVGAHAVASVLYSYGLLTDAIVRHGDIAVPWYGKVDARNRRHDPSNFPGDLFYRLIAAWTAFFRTLTAPADVAYWVR